MKYTYLKYINVITSIYTSFKLRKRSKIFCIGRNKTGTTSLKKAFDELGFITGNQTVAEKIYDKYYFKDNFKKIIKFCKTAEVFQDVPFSCPETFKYLDKAFPGSKFILTIRDSDEQWYCSITKFHAKHFGSNKNIPTTSDLKEADYVRKGFMYNTVKLHGTLDSDPYNKEIMINHYNNYNKEVLNYFKDRKDDLLVINLSDPDAYGSFKKFLGITNDKKNFPWENKT